MKIFSLTLDDLLKKPSILVLLIFTLLFSQSAIAQSDFFVRVGPSNLTCAFDDSKQGPCKANDLTVLDLIAGDPDNPCAVTCVGGRITLPLTMRINNTTGSTRTAFALYGSLSTGATITSDNGTASGNVFICVGPISITQGINSFPIGTISFPCDATALTLSNNYLAYTPANSSTESFCATLSNAVRCQDIGPKCGVAQTINIVIPVTATAATAKEPCIGANTGGSIRVTANNGKAPYSARIYANPSATLACSSTEPTTGVLATLNIQTKGGNATTSETLPAGRYCIYVTDGNGCTYVVSHTIDGVNCCINPPKPVIASTSANICQPTVTVTVCNAVKDVTYKLTSNGQEYSIKATSDGALAFASLTPGAGFSVFGQDLVHANCSAGPTANCSNTTVLATCPAPMARIASESRVATQEIKLEDAPTRVTVVPNPYKAKISFKLESAISGQGSLDLYNTLGQKVATVYRGYIEKGRVQNIEYTVLDAQRANLIYVFTVGDQKKTGKLLQLK